MGSEQQQRISEFVREHGPRLCGRLGLDGPLFFLAGQPTVILMYHGVVPSGTRPDLWVQLERHRFESQMRYLADHRPVVSLEDMIEGVRGRRTLPQGAVAITFDDGYYNLVENALPTLEKYRLPATIFVTAGLVGSDRLLWTDQIYERLLGAGQDDEGLHQRVYEQVQQLKRMPDHLRRQALARLLEPYGGEPRAGRDHPWRIVDDRELKALAESDLITIGAHSVTHPLLPNLPLDLAKREIEDSKRMLEARIGRRVRLFAYPDGAHDARTAQLVREAGFSAAVSTRLSRLRSHDDLYSLGRYPVGGRISDGRFALLMAGLDELASPLRSRLGTLRQAGGAAPPLPAPPAVAALGA